VGNPGRDPFGEPTRTPPAPHALVRGLAAAGARGVSFHDDDLIPPGTSGTGEERIKRDFRRALDDTGLVVSMATTNLFRDAVFKDGAFTSHDRRVRRYALQKTLRAIDLGAELGAPVYVFWGGREGSELHAASDPRDALARYAEAIDLLCAYVVEQGYPMRFAIEPKPNEPRGDIFLPTVGHALAFITRLERPDMVGVNPEVAHETMAGLSIVHAVGQALWQGKLFHIDLNAQKPGRFDQDLRFGAEDLKEAFFLVKLLEEAGYDGPLHFDAHALRQEPMEGVWEFARGCIRTYEILRGKLAAFRVSEPIQELLGRIEDETAAGPPPGEASPAALREEAFDLDALRARPVHHERLDQLVIELLLGAADYSDASTSTRPPSSRTG
jgi:xylose isomerase